MVISSINLKQLFQKVLHLTSSQITIETSCDTHTQWDSIAHFDIITSLEKILQENIPPAEVSRLTSIKSIIIFLKQKGFRPIKDNLFILTKKV